MVGDRHGSLVVCVLAGENRAEYTPCFVFALIAARLCGSLAGFSGNSTCISGVRVSRA